MNLNAVTLTGNLTRDPESFSAGCKLGLAVNERVKQNDEWTDRASFFDVTVFGNQAERCMEYLAKGSPVALSGRLRQDRWQTEGGENRSKVVVIAHQVQFLRSPDRGDKGDGAATETSADEAREAAAAAKADEDYPF